MLLGIDHIVIAVPDLDTAIKNYEHLGFTVVPGGKHPVGTHNGLIALADGSYIELIAFYRENPQHRWWDALQKGGGLVDFCMQTDDLTGDTAKLRSAGVQIDDPVPWSRTRPDGYQLKWLLSLARGEHRGVAPFLIQDETPREERVPRETSHRNGACGIGCVTIAVNDVSTAERWYRAVLGAEGAAVKRHDLEASGLSFRIGPHCIALLVPRSPGSPVASWLKTRGPSPYAATLRGQKDAVKLESNLTCGAALWFE